MYHTCRHIMPMGRVCQSPAMRESAYCYFHARLHRYPYRRTPSKKEFKLPPLDSRKAIQTANGDVLNAMLAGRIDARRTTHMLHGLQVATTNFNRASETALLLPTVPGRSPTARQAIPQETTRPGTAHKSATPPSI
jgi:hypothetical protein